MPKAHKPLPVKGYSAQGADNVALVNANKEIEERLLRLCDKFRGDEQIDKRWLAVAITHFEQGFMALDRSIFKPGRVKLPEDQA